MHQDTKFEGDTFTDSRFRGGGRKLVLLASVNFYKPR